MSINSIEPQVFYVEQSSHDPSPPGPNTPIVFNSTEMSGNDTREMISISSIASPEPQIMTIDSHSNQSTQPHGFWRQLSIIPPSLNDLSLPPIPFNILATMAVVNPTEDGHDENCSPQSPDLSEPSPISTPPMNVSTIDNWETPHTTTDDNTFYSEDEPRRVYWTSPWMKLSIRKANPDESTCCPILSRRHHLARWKGSWRWECPFQKRGECRSMSTRPADSWFPQQRTFQDRRLKTKNSRDTKTTFMKIKNL